MILSLSLSLSSLEWPARANSLRASGERHNAALPVQGGEGLPADSSSKRRPSAASARNAQVLMFTTIANLLYGYMHKFRVDSTAEQFSCAYTVTCVRLQQ